MKIFLSWSGERSKAIAAALHDWLPIVVPGIQPFFSPGIPKGAKWSGELDAALEGTQFGVVCLTPENLDSTWIHFEAGALSKTGAARIWTLLLELTPGAVPQPLGKFQHTMLEQGDLRAMLLEINTQLRAGGGEPRSLTELDRALGVVWPQLEAAFRQAEAIAVDHPTAPPTEPQARGVSDKLDEVLELLRAQRRQVSEVSLTPVTPVVATHNISVVRLATLGPMSATLTELLVRYLREWSPVAAIQQVTHSDGQKSINVDLPLRITDSMLDSLVQRAAISMAEPTPDWQVTGTRPPMARVVHRVRRRLAVVPPEKPATLQASDLSGRAEDVLDLD